MEPILYDANDSFYDMKQFTEKAVLKSEMSLKKKIDKVYESVIEAEVRDEVRDEASQREMELLENVQK